MPRPYWAYLQQIGDPLPQALVLTAIVIGFGMTAFLVVLAMRTCADWGNDHVDGAPPAIEDIIQREQRRAMNHMPILPVLLPSLAGILMLLPPLSSRGSTCSAGWPGSYWRALVVIGGILLLSGTAPNPDLWLGRLAAAVRHIVCR
jgi:hypothetical protein